MGEPSSLQSYCSTAEGSTVRINPIAAGACYDAGMADAPDALLQELIRLSEAQNVARQDIAAALGVVPSQISNIFNGRSSTTPGRMARWAELVGRRLIMQMVPRDREPVISEMLTVLLSMTPEDAALALRFAKVLLRLDPLQKPSLGHQIRGMELAQQEQHVASVRRDVG